MFNNENYISSPRPLFENKPDELKKGVQRLKLGGTSSGIVVDVSRTGLTINGYYQSFNTEKVFYSCVRDSVEIKWSEFEKIRKEASRKKRKRTTKKVLEPNKTDKPDKKYLEGLPVVTINKKKYYLDSKLRERRPIDRPENVFNY